MTNPFTEERKKKFLDNAEDFLTSFSQEYSKLYGVSALEQIQKEMQSESEDPRKLSYRDWDSVERPELFHGPCFMKTGEGPGDFSKWKQVYIAETQEYEIQIYNCEKDFESSKKPHAVIQVTGYNLNRDPSWYYSCTLARLASGLGLSGVEVEFLTSYSQHAWALTHRWRENYIFQLHKAREPLCMCLGGSSIDSNDAGAAEACYRDRYVCMMERCVTRAAARELDQLTSVAFDKTMGKMVDIHKQLHRFSDDGTEPQILTDMVMEQCFLPIQDEMLKELEGPVSIRLTLWYSMRGMVYLSVNKMAEAVWSTMEKGTHEIYIKIEPVIRESLDEIVKAKHQVHEKIREVIVNPAGKLLQSNVTGFIEPIMKKIEQPLKNSFMKQRSVFVNQVPTINTLPDGENQRNIVLDRIPRQYALVKDMCDVTYEMVEPLRQLQESSDTLFGDLDPYKYRQDCEDALLQTLDAAIYSLEIKILARGQDNDHKETILQDFDHDVMLARSQFIKTMLRDLLLGGFKRALHPTTHHVISDMDSLIPEDMQEFVSISALYDDVINRFIGEPIDQMVDGAYLPPMNGPGHEASKIK